MATPRRRGREQGRSVVVIGAGLAGLSAAAAAAQAGAAVTLVEAGPAVGGFVSSRQLQDHRFDFGPLTLLTGHPAVATLLRAAQAQDRVVQLPAAELQPNLYLDGRVCPLPRGPVGWALSPVLRTGEKMRALAEPLAALRQRRSALQEVSVRRLLEQRLGAGATHRVATPLLQGIYGGGDYPLELRAALPQVYAFAQRGSLLAGALAQRRRGQRRGLGVVRGGLAAALYAAAKAPGITLQTGTTVTAIEAAGDGQEAVVSAQRAGTTVSVRAQAVVVALPAWAAAPLLRPIDGGVADDLAAVPHGAMVQVAVAADELAASPLPGGFGILVGPSERLRMLGVAFHHRLAPGAVPRGRWSLLCYFGGRPAAMSRLLARSDEALGELACGELRKLLGGKLTHPLVAVQRLPQAIPQPVLGHSAMLARLRARLQLLPWLWLTGSHVSGVAVHQVVGHGLGVGAAAAGEGSPAPPPPT